MWFYFVFHSTLQWPVRSSERLFHSDRTHAFILKSVEHSLNPLKQISTLKQTVVLYTTPSSIPEGEGNKLATVCERPTCHYNVIQKKKIQLMKAMTASHRTHRTKTPVASRLFSTVWYQVRPIFCWSILRWWIAIVWIIALFTFKKYFILCML